MGQRLMSIVTDLNCEVWYCKYRHSTWIFWDTQKGPKLKWKMVSTLFSTVSTFVLLQTEYRYAECGGHPYLSTFVIEYSLSHTHISWRNHMWFIHCLMTGSQPLQKQILHTVQSSASFFNFQYPLSSLMLFISCLCFLPRLPITSIIPSIFPSITCFTRQVLYKMWQRQSPLVLFIVYRIFLTFLTHCGHTSGGVTGDTNFKFYLTLSNIFFNN
jgi:hypothetical protein